MHRTGRYDYEPKFESSKLYHGGFSPGEIMPIAISCDCGKNYRLKDSLAGKKFRCSECDRVVKVPQQESSDEAELDDFNDLLTEARKQESRQPAAPPPVKKKPKVKKAAPEREYDSDGSDDRRERSGINAGVAGGLLMIVGAIVWFVGGLFFGYIFFYPPILLIIGIIAVVKGLLGGD